MKITKTLFVALALSAIPTLSFAMCEFGKQHASMSCAEGMVWDTETRTCVQPTG